MSHTPGPWRVGPHYRTDVESAYGRVCECGLARGPQAEADARLIAAAPTLLAVLQEVVDIGESIDGAGNRYTFDYRSPLGQRVRDAIREAKEGA